MGVCLRFLFLLHYPTINPEPRWNRQNKMLTLRVSLNSPSNLLHDLFLKIEWLSHTHQSDFAVSGFADAQLSRPMRTPILSVFVSSKVLCAAIQHQAHKHRVSSNSGSAISRFKPWGLRGRPQQIAGGWCYDSGNAEGHDKWIAGPDWRRHRWRGSSRS